MPTLKLIELATDNTLEKVVMMIKYILLFIVSSLFFSCSNTPTRKIASDNIIGIVARINSEVNEFEFSYEGCSSTGRELYASLFELSSQQVILEYYTNEQLETLLNDSFKIRSNIRTKLYKLDPDHVKANNCIKAISDLNRALRYLEDYIIGHLYQTDSSKEYITLEGEGGYYLKNDESFKSYEDLRSGDVILSRGNAYTSAAIARIGANDAQFSHLSFVYKDEQGQLWTIESHIEIGAVVAPIDVHINQKNSRTLVFRYKDQALAHKAAKAIFEKVKKQSQTGRNIEYDFGMDYKNDDRLFCSEVIYQGFQYVSKEEIDIPRIKTQFNAGLISFLNRMGIAVSLDNINTFKTFSPGDIEYDSNFSLIAEWRNPNKLAESRIKDMILTKMFEWMENENYTFYPSFAVRSQSNIFWLLRRTPILKKFADEKFPLNMKTEQLKLFLTLDVVGDAIYHKVLEAQSHQAYAFSPQEMFKLIEQIREEDLRIYNNKKRKSIFHRWFRQKK